MLLLLCKQNYCSKVFFSEKSICQETIGEFIYLYAPRSCILFVNGADDDATTCAFSRGCCEVNWTAVTSRLWRTVIQIEINNVFFENLKSHWFPNCDSPPQTASYGCSVNFAAPPWKSTCCCILVCFMLILSWGGINILVDTIHPAIAFCI
jgi:hypothetical protein